jgi:hypothetical protein
VADDFRVPAGACWEIGAITFFAYQTGATVPTITGVNFQIWNGPPNAGGVVIYGNTTTNTLAAAQLSGIRRSIDTGACATNRLIMADICVPPAPLVLNAGTYWIDWQTSGTLTSGPWAPPVTILGASQKPGSNGLQWSGTAWTTLLDNGTAQTVQDLPFIIEGFPCATPVENTTWGAIKNLY